MSSHVFSKFELLVQLSSNEFEDVVKAVIERIPDISIESIDEKSQSVVVKTTLNSDFVRLQLEEGTKARTVLIGHSVYSAPHDVKSSAVCALSGTDIKGLLRFHQGNVCVIEGVVDGLSPGLHGLHIHAFGDLSAGAESCGDHFDLTGNSHGGPDNVMRHTGDLGNIIADNSGRATFRFVDSQIKVPDIIGRSVCVDEEEDDLGRGVHELSKKFGNSGKRIACGIIARSAGVLENSKRICDCDGVLVWDERDVPLAGGNRSQWFGK